MEEEDKQRKIQINFYKDESLRSEETIKSGMEDARKEEWKKE